jgi:superoxide reductase
MHKIPRRTLLFSALAAPAALAHGALDEPPFLQDIEGRPIQRIADPANMSAHEREHLIEIVLPDEIKANEPFSATFRLPNHPFSNAHHIAWMRVFVDKQLLSYVTFAPRWMKPEATFTLQFTKANHIEAVAECNSHGIWGAIAPITIKYPEAPLP